MLLIALIGFIDEHAGPLQTSFFLLAKKFMICNLCLFHFSGRLMWASHPGCAVWAQYQDVHRIFLSPPQSEVLSFLFPLSTRACVLKIK